MNKRQAKKYYKKLEDNEKLAKWGRRYIDSYRVLNKVYHRTIKCRMNRTIPNLDYDFVLKLNYSSLWIIKKVERDAPTLARKLRHDYHLRLNDPLLRKHCRRRIQHGITKH